jgi:two-component system sensor histidine kinase EvgS
MYKGNRIKGKRIKLAGCSLIRPAAFFIVALILLSASLCAQPPVLAKRILQSASEIDYPPFCLVDKKTGAASGFSVELFRAALKKMGYDANFKINTWPKVRAMLENGEVRALPLVGRTPERETQFDFTVPYLTLTGAIIVRKDNSQVKFVQNLEGKEVAVMKNDNAEEFLLRNGFVLHLKRYSTFLDALNALNQGQHEAVIMQRYVAKQLIAENELHNLKIIKFPIAGFNQDFCFAVQEGDKDMLAVLNEGLMNVINDGTYQLLHAKWFAEIELDFTRPTIVGGDQNFPPFEFLDEHGEPTGYNVDLVKAIASATNLKIQFQLGRWPQMIKGLKQGDIDMIQGMFYSPERASRFRFTARHMTSHYVAVTHINTKVKPEKLADLQGLKILVQNGDIMHDYLLKNGLASQTILVDSQQSALWSLLAGQGDCALVSRLTATYLKRKYNWDKLAIGQKALYSPEYGMAVGQSNKALLAQLDEGLQMVIDNGEYQRIHNKWLGIEHRQQGYQKILLYISWFTVPLILLGLFFILWSWSLKHQVAKKTLELHKSRQHFKTIIEGSPYAILVEVEGQCTYVNALAVKLFGFKKEEELLGKIVKEILPSQAYAELPDAAYESDHEQTAVEYKRSKVLLCNKLEVPVEISAVPTVFAGKNGAMIFLRDISRQLELEDQLRQTSKIEAIGHLAGGIAHDYNNMLSVILGYTEMALSTVREDSETYELLQEALEAAESSSVITRQLLAFASKQAIVPKVININGTVENMLKMIKRLIGEGIELLWLPGNDLWATCLDPAQVNQVLANLCVNARDAIKGNGQISIKTQNLRAETVLHGHISPGEYVQLSVCDNGVGMSEELKKQIFEPFFTTKELGRGTGLGLATVYGIARQNGGFVQVNSEVDKGTCFEVFFPRSKEAVQNCEKIDKPQSIQGNQQYILVVEDDQAILKLTGRILKNLGYRVHETTSTLEAVKLARQHKNDIELLLTDVIMPKMNGKELYLQVKDIIPGIKCLYTSGYTADIIAEHGVLEDGVNFLEKPYSAGSLSEKVSEILFSGKSDPA